MIDYAESWQTVAIHTCPAAPTLAQEAATRDARGVSTQCKKGNGYKRKARTVLVFFCFLCKHITCNISLHIFIFYSYFISFLCVCVWFVFVCLFAIEL